VEYRAFVWNLEGQKPLKESSTDWRIVLKWISRKRDVGAWTE
jgi:hypothetical protein